MPIGRLKFLIKATALIATVSVLLILPRQTETRPLWPSEMPEALQLGKFKPSDPIFADNSPTFKLAIKPDIAESARTFKWADLLALTKEEAQSRYQERARLYPHRFTDNIALPTGTFARINHCDLVLILDGHLRSRKLPCKGLQDNQNSRFQFDHFIYPGIYEAQIETTATSADNAIVIYLASSPDGTYWALAHSNPPVSTGRALWDWMKRLPYEGSIYGLMIILLIMLVSTGGRSTWSWAMAVACFYLAVAAITPPLSGHDETAHVDMLHHQISKASGLPSADIKSEKKAFNISVNQFMVEHDFYRLHKVGPNPPEACPHKILGSCGHSAKPLWLYKQYAELLHLFTSQGGEVQASSLIYQTRIIHLALTLLTLGLILLLFGRDYLKLGFFLLLTSLPFSTNFNAITNDFPMFLTGLMILIGITHFLTERSAKASLLFLTTVVGLLFFIKNIDRSWLASLPAVICLAALLVGHWWLSDRSSKAPHHTRSKTGLIYFFAMTASSAVVTFWGVLFIIKNWDRQILQLLASIQPDLRLLQGLKYFEPQTAATGLWDYYRSLVGSFVWGHAYLPTVVYQIFFLAGLYLSYRGAKSICKHRDIKQVRFIAGILGLLFAAQSIIVIAVLYSYYPFKLPVDSLVKVRLTAPGLAAILVLPSVGWIDILRTPAQKQWLYRSALLFGLMFLVFFASKFYLVDLY